MGQSQSKVIDDARPKSIRLGMFTGGSGAGRDFFGDALIVGSGILTHELKEMVNKEYWIYLERQTPFIAFGVPSGLKKQQKIKVTQRRGKEQTVNEIQCSTDTGDGLPRILYPGESFQSRSQQIGWDRSRADQDGEGSG